MKPLRQILKKARQFKARAAGFFHGAGRKRALSGYNTQGSAARLNDELNQSLDILRDRSRDLFENNPVARALIHTIVSGVIGKGLTLVPTGGPDTYQARIVELWRVFEREADLRGTRNLTQISRTAFRNWMIDGEGVSLLPRVPQNGTGMFDLRVQNVDAVRLKRPQGASHNGILFDSQGRPVQYYIQKNAKSREVAAYRARNAAGDKNVLHWFHAEWSDQERGKPLLSPVIARLKSLWDYILNEGEAAALTACFTFLVPDDEPLFNGGGEKEESEIKFEPGAWINFVKDPEKIKTVAPTRPNSNFEQFVAANLREIAAAVGVPFEVLLKAFSSSYSASRASLQVAYQFFNELRCDFVSFWFQPIFEAFLNECVLKGYVEIEGYMDPLIKSQFLDVDFIGAAPLSIDPVKDAKAAVVLNQLKVKTLDEISIELTGKPFRGKVSRFMKEVELIGEIEGGQDAVA